MMNTKDSEPSDYGMDTSLFTSPLSVLLTEISAALLTLCATTRDVFMLRRWVCIWFSLSLSVLVGCEEAPRSASESRGGVSAPDPSRGGERGGETSGETSGVETSALPIRHLRRVSVDQLARIIPTVTGGLRWVEDFGAGPVDILELLAPTLGAPDYRGVTVESLEPNLLMSKFLSDGAQRVCLAWVQRDRSAEPAGRTLVRHAAPETEWGSLDAQQMRANLARLLLRFFAYTAEPAEGNPRVEALASLFESVVAVSPDDPAGDGWLAVCLALMTDPEFTLY